MALDSAAIPRLRVPVPRPPAEPEQKCTGSSPRLLRWSELQEWQQGDGLIETGHRPAMPSLRMCFQSWFYIHNETANIFTHLIGAILFFTLPFPLYREMHSRYTTARTGDVVVFALYLFGVATCFTLSTAFHTLAAHSPRGSALGIQLDFQGVVLLMWGASAPLVYYTFRSEPALQRAHWGLVSLSALLASLATFAPAFRLPGTKPRMRAGVFAVLALCSLSAVGHGLARHGWAAQSRRFPMWGVGATLVLDALGALVYVAKFPERWWRVRFDIWGASHQLMHVAIVLAGLAWLGGMLEAFDNAHSGPATGGEVGGR